MDRPLSQLRDAQNKYQVPILVAGDIFDKHNPNPQLINWVIERLRTMNVITIPGNHDLPAHNLEDINNSAYWTLVQADAIQNLSPRSPVEWESGPMPVRVHAFPFGVPLKPLKDPRDLFLEIALVHDMVWSDQVGFQGEESASLKARLQQLKGFDVSIWGDNHSSFSYNGKKKNPAIHTLVNCGSLMRRTVTQINHQPSITVIYSDGSTQREYLDCSKDLVTMKEEPIRIDGQVSDAVNSLKELKDSSIDFELLMRRIAESDKTKESVRRIILEAMEKR